MRILVWRDAYLGIITQGFLHYLSVIIIQWLVRGEEPQAKNLNALNKV